MKINIIFPNQLFKDSEHLDKNSTHYIIEENMFFNHYNFHKQKIYFHRCSMKNYYDFLVLKGLKVNYINSNDENSDIRKFIDQLNSTEIDKIQCIDPEDNWTNQRCSEAHERPFYVLQNSHNIFLRSDQSDIHHELCCTEDIQPINFEDGDIIPVSQTMNDYFNR